MGAYDKGHWASAQAQAAFANIYAENWSAAALVLNGLNMYEMLRVLNQMNHASHDALFEAVGRLGPTWFKERMQYAREVVTTHKVPKVAPGDLAATGQVGDAVAFINRYEPLWIRPTIPGMFPTPTAPPVFDDAARDVEIRRVAADLKVPEAVVDAVAMAESHGAGFRDAMPTIRYELHTFGRYTKHKFDKTHPHIAKRGYVKADNKTYHSASQDWEWSMLANACLLDDQAAKMSVSWGAFQIMGENWSAMKYADVDGLVADAFAGHAQHFDMFVKFCRSKGGVISAMQKQDWDGVGRLYNGDTSGSYAGSCRQHYARTSAKWGAAK